MRSDTESPAHDEGKRGDLEWGTTPRLVIAGAARWGDHPAIVSTTDETTSPLGQQERGMASRHRHKSIATSVLNSLTPGCHERVIRTWKRNPINNNQTASVARNIDPLPQRHSSK